MGGGSVPSVPGLAGGDFLGGGFLMAPGSVPVGTGGLGVLLSTAGLFDVAFDFLVATKGSFLSYLLSC